MLGGDNAEEKGKSSVRIKEAGDRDYFNSNIISWISLVASTYFIEQNALRRALCSSLSEANRSNCALALFTS